MRELTMSEISEVSGGDFMNVAIGWAGIVVGAGAATILGGGAMAILGAGALGYGVVTLASWGYSLATS